MTDTHLLFEKTRVPLVLAPARLHKPRGIRLDQRRPMDVQYAKHQEAIEESGNSQLVVPAVVLPDIEGQPTLNQYVYWY